MGYTEWKNAGSEVILLGKNTSYDVSNYKGYENFNSSNFIIGCISFTGKIPPAPKNTGTYTSYPTVNYNATTGIVTVKNTSASQENGGYGDSQYQEIKFNLYLVI